MATETFRTWPGTGRPPEWSVWPDRPEAPDRPARTDRLDRIGRLLDDADADDMTLLRLVVAVALTLGVLGLVLHLLG